MPEYPWLFDKELDTTNTVAKIKAMQTLGVPYEKGFENIANKDLVRQSNEIVARLKSDGIDALPEMEIIAMIAYLQRMGTDIKGHKK